MNKKTPGKVENMTEELIIIAEKLRSPNDPSGALKIYIEDMKEKTKTSEPLSKFEKNLAGAYKTTTWRIGTIKELIQMTAPYYKP